MSNLFLGRWVMAGALTLALAALSAAIAPGIGRSQADPQEDPIAAVARFMIESSLPKAPMVPYPLELRPSLEGTPSGLPMPVAACSIERPLCVRSTDPSDASLALLAALEQAYDFLLASGWPLPRPDGGRDGTAELDVYLVPNPSGADAGVDALLPVSALDAASTFARLDPHVPEGQRFACAVQALAHAGLRAADPAEAAIASEPVAAFVAFLATGAYGCKGTLDAAQFYPELGVGVLSREHELVADTALTSSTHALLALIFASRRHDGGDGDFIREVWQLTRQKSPEVARVRASPNFYEALDRALRNAGESLELLAEELAVARFFASRTATSALPAMRASSGVPVVIAPPFEALPAHLAEHSPTLGPMGSAYTMVDTSRAPEGSQLKVWLRSDLGPRFALTAVRLGANGNEIGRMSAPARRVPESFLPVELSPDTTAVLLVVTLLPHDLRSFGREQPVEPARLDHGFRLILGK